MGIASLVLGILALLGSWIPIFGFFWIPGAIVGIVLGAVAVSKSKKDEGDSSRGLSMAGLVVSIVALVSIIGFTVFWASTADDIPEFDLEEAAGELQAQPVGAVIQSGLLNFQTQSYDCQPAESLTTATNTCVLEFNVDSASDSDEAVVNSTDQHLVYASLNPVYAILDPDSSGVAGLSLQSKYSLETIVAESGSCVDQVVEPLASQSCQATFTVPGNYVPQFARYVQAGEAVPSDLILLPTGTPS